MPRRPDGRSAAARRGAAPLAVLALLAAAGSGCSRSSNSDPAAIVSVAESATNGAAPASPNAPTAAQIERRRKSTEAIAAMGLPTLPTLPVVEDETALKPRAANEIADRCIATAICAVKAETRDQTLVDAMTKTFDAAKLFSPEEARFVHDAAPAADQLPKFGWRYECVHVFLWALGYLPELAPPNKIADVTKVVAILQGKAAPKALAADAKLRPMREVLDMTDLYYRLHWATTELSLKGQKSEAASDDIVVERHRALNWLVRYMNQEWDDVTTDT